MSYLDDFIEEAWKIYSKEKNNSKNNYAKMSKKQFNNKFGKKEISEEEKRAKKEKLRQLFSDMDS